MTKRWIRALPVILGALLLGALVWAIASGRQRDAYRAQLEGMYEKSFYELVDGIGNMEVDLSKLLITETPESSLLLLSDLWRKADGAQASFSLLPAQDGEDTAKFVNQLGDYCYSLAQKVSQGQPLAEEDRARLLALRERLVTLGNHMRGVRASGSGAYLWAAALDPPAEEGADPLDDIARPGIDYPSLVYDGPFSDAREEDAVPLTGAWIDRDEAIRLAKAFVGEARVEWAEAAPEGAGDIPTFGVEMMLSRDGVVTVQVTKQGGHILWMIPERSPGDMYYGLEDALAEALRFAEERGYPEVELSYYQVYGGVAVFNLIPTQNGILLYPDLFKIQVSLETCQVIGVEAGNYLRRHRVRALPEVAFPQEEALLLATRLEVRLARLCVIPKLDQEILCHEITGTFLGEDYILYIDAESGKEVQLYKIIDVEGGQLAL